ncbi:MAG: DUF2807 domain-containing protein [Rhodobacteraceae bacterium]|nr:DUF2807 domain-containing protein [Paracoccaceae bacterium]
MFCISGAGLDVSGSCETLEVSASSRATVDARDFICETVEVSVSSGADARVFAPKQAESHASSGASSYVHGNPNHTDFFDRSGGDTELRN